MASIDPLKEPFAEGQRDRAAAQALCLSSDPEAEGHPDTPVTSLRSELANIPLFGDLDPDSLHTLIRNVRVVSLDAGQVLFREGDPANSLYVIVEGAVVPIAEGGRRRKLAVLERGRASGGLYVVLSGTLSVVGPEASGSRSPDKELATLGLGDVFGGLSLLEGRLPSGDVVARGTCWLVMLGEGRARRILETNPRLERVLRRIAIESVEASGPGERDVVML